jgi:hypothetical protein
MSEQASAGVTFKATAHHLSFNQLDEWIKRPRAAADFLRRHVSSNLRGCLLERFGIDSPGILVRGGWSRDVLATGERITVEYRPLRDGRNGGHFMKATRADGSVLLGVGGPGTGISAPVIPPVPK